MLRDDYESLVALRRTHSVSFLEDICTLGYLIYMGMYY